MRIKTTKTKTHKSRKWLIGLVCLVAIVGLSITAYAYEHSHHTKPSSVSTPVAIAPNTVNYAPATPTEKAESDSHKDQLAQQMQQQASGQAASPSASPVITSITQNGDTITVSAYVDGVFEDGGTCQVVATQGSATATASSTAFSNATNTSCPPINMPRASFSSTGSWSFVLKYASTTAQGSSTSKAFTVQ